MNITITKLSDHAQVTLDDENVKVKSLYEQYKEQDYYREYNKGETIVLEDGYWVDALGYSIPATTEILDGLDKIKSILEEIEVDMDEYMFVAGGFISAMLFNKEYNDIDIYTLSDGSIPQFDGCEVIDSFKGCSTIEKKGHRIQLLRTRFDRRFYQTQEIYDVISTYDLTCCMFAYYRGKIYSYKHVLDVSMRGICFINTTISGKIFDKREESRALKYESRGWGVVMQGKRSLEAVDFGMMKYFEVRVGGFWTSYDGLGENI
jgi:hypothetical protein